MVISVECLCRSHMARGSHPFNQAAHWATRAHSLLAAHPRHSQLHSPGPAPTMRTSTLLVFAAAVMFFVVFVGVVGSFRVKENVRSLWSMICVLSHPLSLDAIFHVYE